MYKKVDHLTTQILKITLKPSVEATNHDKAFEKQLFCF